MINSSSEGGSGTDCLLKLSQSEWICLKGISKETHGANCQMMSDVFEFPACFSIVPRILDS